MTTCEHTNEAGAFVLHALDGHESERFVAHLDDCAACRSTVVDLRAVVDTLPMAAQQVAPPASLKVALMAQVEAEAELLQSAIVTPAKVTTRRWSWLPQVRLMPSAVLAGGFACVLIAAGVFVGASLQDKPEPEVVRTIVAQSTPGAAQVRVEMTDDGHTDLVMADMPATPEGKVWQVWRMDGRGRVSPTRTLFSTPADGRARVQVDGGARAGQRLLVSAEPAGGSVAPTSAPVITASL